MESVCGTIFCVLLMHPSEQMNFVVLKKLGKLIKNAYVFRMMVKNKSGLIVNISSIGGAIYLFNVAYGAGKAAVDKMAADAAQELKEDNVTMVSLWPGPVKTEYIQDNLITPGKSEF